MKKLTKVEECIQWAKQQGYCFANDAAAEYGKAFGREFYEDQPYYNLWSWRDVGPAGLQHKG